MTTVGWRVGVEIELMAPRGTSRKDLAAAWATDAGSVTPFFHPQSEPSLVDGMGVFQTLTLGFEAKDSNGTVIARVVDDLTLRTDLEPDTAPKPGWFRIVSDDVRILQIYKANVPADDTLPGGMQRMAALLGTALDVTPPMFRVVDHVGSPVCIGAPLPGERERPTEIVTVPIEADADLCAHLEALLQPARRLGFTVPVESATHLHFDSEPLLNAPTFTNLVELLHTWGDALKTFVKCNPRCTRLGPLPPPLLATVRAPDFRDLPWEEARRRLSHVGLSKYVDYNLKNLVHPRSDKPTFEVRVLPTSLHAAPVVDAAHLFTALLKHAQTTVVDPMEAQTSDALPLLWERIGSWPTGG